VTPPLPFTVTETGVKEEEEEDKEKDSYCSGNRRKGS
jgi:hypothetical protein